MTADSIPRILVIDDELLICKNCLKILSNMKCEVAYALNGYDALKMMAKQPYDIVITDLKMSSLGGMEVLDRIAKNYEETIVIVMTGYASVSSAVEVMKMGAFDYLPKPFTPNELRAVVHQALAQRQIQMQNQDLILKNKKDRPVSHQLIGNSPQIKKVIRMVEKVAPTDSTVLVSGESGTGKELIARAVHANSNRKDKVFFAVDCGTLSGNLLESELFGYTKGAFTGAHTDKEGIFKMAHQGTVFLDEISNTTKEIQGKLLRFLETREMLPIGSTVVQKVDVRLVFATNRNLEDLVAKGDFREDFYYRIFVYPIQLPSLNERKIDILPIAYHFLNQYNQKMRKRIRGFDDKAVSRLTEFDWPGNIRQLKNVIERAVILCETDQITVKELPIPGEADEIQAMLENVPSNNEELKKIKKEIREKAVRKVEKNFILNALSRSNWNVTQAAHMTGFQRTNFQSLIKKHGISRPKEIQPNGLKTS